METRIVWLLALAIAAALMAYVVYRPSRFVFTLSVTIPKANIDVLFNPENIVSIHPNFYKVSYIARDKDGRLTGTFSEYAKPSLFGIFPLPLPTIDIQFILTTRRNEAFYEGSTQVLSRRIRQRLHLLKELSVQLRMFPSPR